MSNNIIVLSPNDLKSQYILTSKNREFSFFPKFVYNAYNCRIVIKRINKTYFANLLYQEGFEFNPENVEISSTNLQELVELIIKDWKPEIEKNTNFLLTGKKDEFKEDEELNLLSHNDLNKVDIIMGILNSVTEKRKEFTKETDLKKKLKFGLDFIDLLEKERVFTGGSKPEQDYKNIGRFLLDDYEGRSISQLTSRELQLFNIGLKYGQSADIEQQKNFYIERRSEILGKILEKIKDKYDKRDILLEYMNLINEQSTEGGSFSINMNEYEERMKELEKLEEEIQKEAEAVYRGDSAVDFEFKKRMREKGFIETASKPSERHGEQYTEEEMEDIVEFLSECYDGESQFMKLRDESQKEEFLQLCEKWGRTPGALRWIGKLLFSKSPFNDDIHYDRAYTIALIKKREDLGYGDKGISINGFISMLEEKIEKEELTERTEKSINEAIEILKGIKE